MLFLPGYFVLDIISIRILCTGGYSYLDVIDIWILCTGCYCSPKICWMLWQFSSPARLSTMIFYSTVCTLLAQTPHTVSWGKIQYLSLALYRIECHAGRQNKNRISLNWSDCFLWLWIKLPLEIVRELCWPMISKLVFASIFCST